jgi:MOSC domain-containing protein YiiM
VAGRLAGIARHARPRAPMETVDAVEVTVDGGIQGDFRGTIMPGKRGRRQVSLIEKGDWEAAMADLDRSIEWQHRRANLLVEGLDLPQRAGAVIRVGADVRISTTVQCDPCSRMEEVAPGLKAALTPDWRGGVLGRVICGGHIRVGDPIIIEDDQ